MYRKHEENILVDVNSEVICYLKIIQSYVCEVKLIIGKNGHVMLDN